MFPQSTPQAGSVIWMIPHSHQKHAEPFIDRQEYLIVEWYYDNFASLVVFCYALHLLDDEATSNEKEVENTDDSTDIGNCWNCVHPVEAFEKSSAQFGFFEDGLEDQNVQ